MFAKKYIAIIIVAIVAIAAVTIAVTKTGGGDDPADDGLKTQTLTDYYGNEFTVTTDVQRVVVDYGAALRFVSYMGPDATNKIVGSSQGKQTMGSGSASYSYANLPNYTYLSDCSTANAENIKLLNPDILILGCSKGTLDEDIMSTISTMDALGIPVCVVRYLDDVTQDDYKEQVRLMGEIFGLEDRAEELIDGTQEIINDLEHRMDEVSGSKNVYVGGVSFAAVRDFLWSNVTYGGMMYLDPEVVKNAAITMNPVATYQVELEWDDLYNYQKNNDIDLAILDVAGYGLTETDYTKSPSPYHRIHAIGEGDFYYMLPQTDSGTLHDNTIIAAYILGSILFPEQFADVNLEETAKEVWSLFLDSDECGSAAYDGVCGYIGGITGTESLYGIVPFIEV